MTVSGVLGKTTLAAISNGTLAAGGNIAGLTLNGAATNAKILSGTISVQTSPPADQTTRSPPARFKKSRSKAR